MLFKSWNVSTLSGIRTTTPESFFCRFFFKAIADWDDEKRAREVPHFVSERPKLGEIVLRAGVIDEMQLDAALGEQKKLGERLGTVLIRLGFVTEQELVQALASQMDLPVATLEGKKIPQRVLDIVPLEFAQEHTCIPLFQKEEGGIETLYIGMDNPSDLDVLDDLAFRTGMRVKPVVVATSEINYGIDLFYRALEGSAEAGPSVNKEKEEVAPPDFALEPIVDCRDTNPFEEVLLAGESSELPELVVELADDDSELPELEVEPADEPSEPQALDAEVATETEELPQLEAELVEDEPSAASPAPSAPPASEPSTRLILHALTQIFIEKGLMSREELQQRVLALSQADEGDQDEG